MSYLLDWLSIDLADIIGGDTCFFDHLKGDWSEDSVLAAVLLILVVTSPSVVVVVSTHAWGEETCVIVCELW